MKKEVETNVVIPIKGLAQGVHNFAFLLAQPFFDYFGNQEIREAHIEVAVALEKRIDWVRMDVAITGSVLRACDRCLGDVVAPIAYHAPVMVKFSKEYGEEEGDEIIVLDPSDTEIDLTQYLYDSVCLSLPLQSIHPLGACDPEMEKKIAELSIHTN